MFSQTRHSWFLWMSPFGDPTFPDPTFSDPGDPTFSDLTFEKSSQPCVFVLVMGGNIFYTTEAAVHASYNYYSSLIFFFFLDPFQIIHRSIKQTHFPLIIFCCVAGKNVKYHPWPGLTLPAMIKVFGLSSFH